MKALTQIAITILFLLYGNLAQALMTIKDDDTFAYTKEVLSAAYPVVIEFSDKINCGTCVEELPLVDKASKDLQKTLKIVVMETNIMTRGQKMKDTYQVIGYPTYRLFLNGQQVGSDFYRINRVYEELQKAGIPVRD